MHRSCSKIEQSSQTANPRQSVNRIQTLAFVIVSLFTAAAAPAQTPVFKEVARQIGLDFIHFNGMSGEFYFPEMTGQGGGFLDYDNDGDLDVYLVQGAMLGAGKTLDDALFRRDFET